MVVDDEKDLRHFARLLIEAELHATVTECDSGAEAIAKCFEEHFDVMLLDMHMPEMDGLEVIRMLSNLSDRPCLVAWSADEIALRRAADLGADAKVEKTDLLGLENSVRFCLHLRGKDESSE